MGHAQATINMHRQPPASLTCTCVHACMLARSSPAFTHPLSPRSCERCNQNSAPTWRYMLQLSAGDHTGVQWMNAFSESGEIIIGHKEEELRRIREQNEEEYQRILRVSATTLMTELWESRIDRHDSEVLHKDSTRITLCLNLFPSVHHTCVHEGRACLDLSVLPHPTRSFHTCARRFLPFP